ncbi:hypothetical protein [Gorillibacterium sp. sgz5001074]|uniref:hypothetical protein n=1 Tax=Gorillibacterium sp. sgz5001074 TaxID=3446695 RepID=UPI003F67DDB8
MPALSEFELEMVFIREAGVTAESPGFPAEVERELDRLFRPYGQWGMNRKEQGPLEMVVVEMKGIGPWCTEDEMLDYMESKSQAPVWENLQGYRLRVEPKEDAGCCKCKS